MYNFIYLNQDTLKPADVLLILPPFVPVESPSIGLHILQACAKEAGYSVHICYINLAFARLLGYQNYKGMCGLSNDMLGEMFFANVAYGTSPFSQPEYNLERSLQNLTSHNNPVCDVNMIKDTYSKLDKWLDDITDDILQLDYKIIGCSTTFNQTSASIALLNRIKSKNPNITTIIGGGNCEGEMAEGILTLSNKIDYVFSGKSELSFPDFLKKHFNSVPLSCQIIESHEPTNIETIPMTDYTHYYEQLQHFNFDQEIPNEAIFLPYETSRGCWWGEKHQCNFCGTNGHDLVYNQKSCSKVIHELKLLLANHPSNYVVMTDNIMPYSYTDSLIPLLKKEFPDIRIFYAVKSNTSLEKLIQWKNAGITHLQPGIESFSTPLLKKMSKGASAKLNVQFLKNTHSLHIKINWNLLYGIPGDESNEYEETLKLLPLLVHLQPPDVFVPITLQRFSNYFNNTDKFGISKLVPYAYHNYILPKTANIPKTACFFTGEYERYAYDDAPLILEIRAFIEKWKKSWESNTPPKLHIRKVSKNKYLLTDTRGLTNNKSIQIITEKQAFFALKDRPIDYTNELEEEIQWAIDQHLIVELDGWYVSLISAEAELLLEVRNKPNFENDLCDLLV